MIQNETRSPTIIRKIDENDFLGLAQEKKNGIIKAFLPSKGRESRNRIYVKTCVKLGNDGRNGIAEDDTRYCIWKKWRFMPNLYLTSCFCNLYYPYSIPTTNKEQCQ